MHVHCLVRFCGSNVVVRFAGPIPTEIGYLTALKTLNLNVNELSGIF